VNAAPASSAADRYAPFQRLLDVVLGSILLAAATPVLAVAALAIRLDSPGPVLFRQTRAGRSGRPFTLLKLRSMVVGADPMPHRRHIDRLLSGDGRGDAWAPLDDDPRVTRVGRVLRALALDEVPQLANVLRGDMSLVGPRPALPYELPHWQAWHHARLAVRPGMTGLWQVDGRGASDFDAMVRQDLDYIARRSLALDVAILARTPIAVLRGRRAP
jgi:lipopolysaccharide/colanic/teichoic acid biosynthesis glycosyltransferase